MKFSNDQILNTYWPVIEAIIECKGHYSGRKDGIMRVCPDSLGPVFEALAKAAASCPVKREIL